MEKIFEYKFQVIFSNLHMNWSMKAAALGISY